MRTRSGAHGTDIVHHHYRVVDVFTEVPLEGNPLAVFPQAEGIEGEAMQRIARELNLSETTFVLPKRDASCVAKVRIFTPRRELPFAGHPTIGTAHVLREIGAIAPGTTHFALEEGIGPVAVRVDPDDEGLLWLTTPPIEARETFDRQTCAAMLGLDVADLHGAGEPRIYATAAGNFFVPLTTTDAVDRAKLDAAAFERVIAPLAEKPTCAFVFAPTSSGAYSRMFSPMLGILEDPATGSATGPLAAFMLDLGFAPRASGTRFISEQGTKMGRRSILHVLVTGDSARQKIEVGGHVTPIATATLLLP